VSKPLLIPMPGNERLAASLTTAADAEIGRILVRRFPDDETYIRFETKIAGRTVTLLCTLAHPDDKFLPLLFAAATARELGAVRVGLVAPYLAYMRQDRRFKAGEAVTSNCFARILSDQFDWIVAVDPHLHRHASLGELFSVPTYVAHAASQISDWVRHEINAPLLIGPDSESEQWVAAVARGAEAPYVVLQKQRHSDREVQVTLPDLARWRARTPVLIVDIVSTGQTMIETTCQLRRIGMPPPICIAVHGIFAGTAFDDLIAAGAARLVSTNTIPHPTNAIDITGPLATEIRSALHRPEIKPQH